MSRLIILGSLLLFSISLFSQTGKITGRIINANSGQTLPNATIVLLENSKIALADQDGIFSFNKLAPGTYSIKCTYAEYQEKIIGEIVVKNADVTTVSVSLEEKKAMTGVVITAKSSARKETVAALLVAQKNNASVSDGISAEAIKKTPDRSTSDVLKRVSGASIQEDRFAIIRGLNDRYNAAFLNGAPLPSSESDRKAFAFDIFPSSILDNLVIYKTATPDKTGEFTGGVIDITTKSIPVKNFLSLSFGASYNSLSTGKIRYEDDTKGKRDWIGLDDGTRALPTGFPSVKEIKTASFTERDQMAKLLGKYKWGVQRRNTDPNYNFQLSKGFNIERKQSEFIGAILSINYNKNFTFTEGEKNSYEFDLTSPALNIVQKGKYRDSLYNEETVIAALANISVKINNRNSLSWKNNFSINSDNKLIRRIGPADYTADTFSFIKDVVRWFTSNKIISSQLSGEHMIGAKKTRINWLAAYSKVDREIPNLARTSYSGVYPDVQTLSANFKSPGTVVQTSGNGTMFSTKSDESIGSFKFDLSQSYTFMKNSQNLVKAGAGYQYRKRNFSSRCIGFVNANSNFDYSLIALPEDQVFLPEHLGLMKNGQNGWSIDDGTLSNSNYSATSATIHAYVMNDQRFFKKLRLIYGVRMEHFNQTLNSIKNLRDSINLDKTIIDFLPSINLVYALTSKINFRLSYASTINRPEFRELAPFLFFDYVTNFSFAGLDTIKRARIQNYDFRFEFFPGRAQLFSISAFYKEFKDPIEIVTIPNTTNQTSYTNSKSGKVYGLEAEFRTLLSTLVGKKDQKHILNRFTLTANAAYIKSNVKLGAIGLFTPDLLVTERALQGQSPYILNGSLGYSDEKKGFSSTLSFNRVGDRILIAGTVKDADIYEKARTVMDFQIAKFFYQNIVELRFNIRDLIGQQARYYFDFDKSKSFTEKDRYFTTNSMPTVYTLSATFKF